MHQSLASAWLIYLNVWWCTDSQILIYQILTFFFLFKVRNRPNCFPHTYRLHASSNHSQDLKTKLQLVHFKTKYIFFFCFEVVYLFLVYYYMNVKVKVRYYGFHFLKSLFARRQRIMVSGLNEATRSLACRTDELAVCLLARVNR